MQHRSARSLFGASLVTLLLAGCSSSNHVVQNGIFQQRKYNHPGWFVDLPAREMPTAQRVSPPITEPAPMEAHASPLVEEVLVDGSALAMGPILLEGILQQPSRFGTENAIEASVENGVALDKSWTSDGNHLNLIASNDAYASGTAPLLAPQDAGGIDIFALLGFIFAFVFPVAGLVLSIIGLNRTRGGGRGHGLALAGLIISIVFLAVYGVAVLH